MFDKNLLKNLGILSLFAVFCSCGDTVKQRACEPVTGDGCKNDESCAVKADGTPACFKKIGSLKEGEICAVPDACGKGLGCVRLFGVARCTRFCDLDRTSKEPCASAGHVPVDLLHERYSEGKCAAALSERPDIGACVLPCDLLSDDCPAPSRCGIVSGWRTPVCRAEASQIAEIGELCGGEVGCPAGALCVTDGQSHVCRALKGDDGCDEFDEVETITGVLGGSGEYEVCKPCADLAVGDWNVCRAPSAASTVCAEGELAVVTPESRDNLALALGDIEEDFEVWTAAHFVDGEFVLGDGVTPVDETLWASGEPNEAAGDCVYFTANGLKVGSCDVMRPGLCTLLH